MQNKYGFIRVSTKKQNEARQVIRMKKLGIARDNIIIEKESGKSKARVNFQNLIKRLNAGDVLYIENVDRLGRDYDGIIKEWYRLTVKKGVVIKILDTPMLDTDEAKHDLLNKFMQNILLHVQAFQAENEWNKIKTRQAQGIAVAKANGKTLGRPKSTPSKYEKRVIGQYKNGEINLKHAMGKLKIKKSAFYNLCQMVSEAQN